MLRLGLVWGVGNEPLVSDSLYYHQSAIAWAERGRLVEQLAQWQAEERALSADIREEPRDSADRAADERGVAVLEPLAERAARRLRAIELALDRAEHGRLGICERCQGRIPATRLRAVPEATLCVRCARVAQGATCGG